MSSSGDRWETCIRRIASDRALLDVLLQGARRRYDLVRRGSGYNRSNVRAWSEAIREVVLASFTDDGVVQLLKKKMQSCNGVRSSRDQVPLGRAVATGTGSTLEAPGLDCICARYGRQNAVGDPCGGDEECLRRTSAVATNSQENIKHIQQSRDLGGLFAQTMMPVLATDSAGCHGENLLDEYATECDGDQNRNGIADKRMSASVTDEDKDKPQSVDGVPILGIFTGNAMLHCRVKRAPESPAAGEENTTARLHGGPDNCEHDQNGGDCSRNRLVALDLGEDVVLAVNEEACHLPSPSACLYSTGGDAPANVVDSVDAIRSAAASTHVLDLQQPPQYPACLAETRLVEEAIKPEAAASVAVCLPTCERRRECEIEVRVDEAEDIPGSETTKSNLVCREDGHLEEHIESTASTTHDESVCHVPKLEGWSGTSGVMVDRVGTPLQTEVSAGNRTDGTSTEKMPSTDEQVVEELVVEEKSAAEAPTFNVGKTTAAPVIEPAGGSVLRGLEVLPEITVEDEGHALGKIDRQKRVRFSDEALWSVHEIRASFERHEIAQLFYTVVELDRMAQEADEEEGLAVQELQEEVEGAVHSWGSLGSFSPEQVDVDVESIGQVSFESHSFDDEDSDDRF